MRQNGVEQAVGAVASQSCFDRGRGIPGPLGFEQQIHVETIAAIRGNATGRGMRLLDVALFLEARQDVPYGRRRHTQPSRGHE
jgi:hypothetical protein